QTNRQRIWLLIVLGLGLTALVLTFSRSGLIALGVGTVVVFGLGGWSGLMSRQMLRMGTIALVVAVALSIPLLVIYFGARPGPILMRLYLYEAALRGYLQHPILGVGLNNSTPAMKVGRQELIDLGIPMARAESADSYYLAILAEV